VNLLRLLQSPPISDTLLDQIRASPSARILLDYLREAAPSLAGILRPLTVSTGSLPSTVERGGYEKPYFAKRSMLTRAVLG